MLHERHFTVAEARDAAPEAKQLAQRVVELKRALDSKGFDLRRHQYFGGRGPNGDRYFPAELEEIVATLQILDERGILVKDLDAGLIDFPHVRANGEEVYLCLRADEDELRYWHPIDAGFSARRPIEEL